MLIVYLLAAYLAVGLLVAIVFVAIGIERAMGGPVSLTLGARVLLIPGALAMWPLVVRRWLSGRPPR